MCNTIGSLGFGIILGYGIIFIYELTLKIIRWYKYKNVNKISKKLYEESRRVSEEWAKVIKRLSNNE